MKNDIVISDDVLKMAKDAEKELVSIYNKCDDICFSNTRKVLNAFINNNVSFNDFSGTNGYGYNDVGREKIDSIFSEIFGAEDSLVRSQFVSGTHALTVCLFAMLRPEDVMLSITGSPYDTLHEVIGIKDNASSLKSFGVSYEEVALKNGEFDVLGIKSILKDKKVKLIEIQRSKGYSTRKSITIEKLEKVIRFIKNIDKDVIVMIDNC